MSALGQKQTFALQKVMSALPPKADMCGATRDVRFGPIADMAATSPMILGQEKTPAYVTTPRPTSARATFAQKRRRDE
jgi:hypothetical protein